VREHGGGGETEQPSRSPEGTRSNRAARKEGSKPYLWSRGRAREHGGVANGEEVVVHQPRRDPPRGHAGGLPARGEVTRGGERGPRPKPSLSSHPRARERDESGWGRERGNRGEIEAGVRVGRGRVRRRRRGMGSARGGDPEMQMRRGEARRGGKAEAEMETETPRRKRKGDGGSQRQETQGLFGWAVTVKKVAVGCELWKKLL
jgi:hypothetical protein